MGRFYQTAKPEFIDDFIYQPPWELIQQNNMLQAQGYQDFLTTATLAGTPDINYIEDEVEKQKVKEIQDEYNNRSTELTNKIKQAGNDWKKYLPEMNKLKRDLESDYKTGRIHNIQTSAANYAEMEKQLSTIKDPIIKEAKKRQLIQQWQKNPNRSIDSIFQSGEVYDRKNLISDFLEQQKLANPEIYSKAFAYADGKGYLHNGVEEVKFRNDTSDALNSYLQLPENLSYLTQMDKDLGLEKYFEEDGKTLIPLTDPRSTAYHMNKYAVNIGDFRQESKEKDIGADSTYMGKLQLAEQRAARQAEYNEVVDSDAAPSIVSNKFLAVNTALKSELLNNIKNNLKGKYNVNITLSNLMSTIERIKKDPKYLPHTRKIIMDTYNQMDSNSKTTKQHFYDTVGDKTKADGYLNNVEQLWKDNHKFYIGFNGDNVTAGETGTVSSKRFSLDNINNIINSKGYFKIGNKKIESIELSKEVLPTMIDRNNLGNNYYTRFATATYKDSNGNEQIITFPVHVPVSEYIKFK